MKIFSFWKKKKLLIDFSDENISNLNKQTQLLKQVLIKNDIEYYSNHLNDILLATEYKNEAKFKELVISRELFGGSGALWEIHIENSNEYNKFNNIFINYIDLITKMGIKHNRISQTKKILQKINRRIN